MTPEPSRRIELLVVDDHTLFRRGLKALLSQDERFAEAREAADVGEALRSLAQAQPDVILLDNHLPGVRGVEAIPSLKEAAPRCRILMLTVSENEEDLAAALQAGADGYLLKTVESDQLCDAIVKVLDGKSVVSPEMMTKLFTVFRSQGAPAPATSAPPLAPLASFPAAPAVSGEPARPAPIEEAPVSEGLAKLSARERQILALIARGDSNKLIARELDIAETTVKIHVQHILRKLNLSSRVQAAVLAVHHNLRD